MLGAGKKGGTGLVGARCSKGRGLLLLSAELVGDGFWVVMVRTKTFTVFVLDIYTPTRRQVEWTKTVLTPLFSGVLPINVPLL